MSKKQTKNIPKTKDSPPLIDLVYCSFCNKSNDAVKKMLAGPGHKINICNECIDLCHRILYGNISSITLDKDALHFSFSDGSVQNLFWINLFSPMPGQNFQSEVLENLFRAYNECVKNEL